MRALIMLAGLAAASTPEPTVPTPVRYRAEISETTLSGGSRTAVLVAQRGRYVTRWTLRCLDDGDRRGHPPEAYDYEGQTPSLDGFLEGHHRDAYQDGRFTLALGSPLWMSLLQGCPARGSARIERLP